MDCSVQIYASGYGILHALCLSCVLPLIFRISLCFQRPFSDWSSRLTLQTLQRTREGLDKPFSGWNLGTFPIQGFPKIWSLWICKSPVRQWRHRTQYHLRTRFDPDASHFWGQHRLNSRDIMHCIIFKKRANHRPALCSHPLPNYTKAN